MKCSASFFAFSAHPTDGCERTVGRVIFDTHTTDRSQWAHVVMFLGPLFAEKKVGFGMPMEHILHRDQPCLYKSLRTETAIQVWSSAAHEGVQKELKQKLTHGVSLWQRLHSDSYLELKWCSLYFAQKISRKELIQQMADVLSDEYVLRAFSTAIRKLKTDRIQQCELTQTLQLFLPEALPSATAACSKQLKWALKYNRSLVSFDEGNASADQYSIEGALAWACKYQRRIRIARWAAEVPDVPLAELLHRNLVTFLRTGRYTPCAEVARSYDYAQQRVYNAVGQLTSAEDFAFDAGYSIDSNGLVTKRCTSVQQHPISHPAGSVTGPALPRSLLWWRPVLDTDVPQQHAPPLPPSEQIGAYPAPSLQSSRRGTSLRGLLCWLSGSTMPAHSPNPLSPEHAIIAQQVTSELGLHIPATDDVMRSEHIDNKENNEEDFAVLLCEAEIAAVATQNAVKKRQATNWQVFLNYKPAPSETVATGSGKSGGRTSLTDSLSRSSLDKRAQDATISCTVHPAGAGNEGYTYGLSPSPASAATSTVPRTETLSASVDLCATPASALSASSLQETISVKRKSYDNMLAVTRSHASSLSAEEVAEVAGAIGRQTAPLPLRRVDSSAASGDGPRTGPSLLRDELAEVGQAYVLLAAPLLTMQQSTPSSAALARGRSSLAETSSSQQLSPATKEAAACAWSSAAGSTTGLSTELTVHVLPVRINRVSNVEQPVDPSDAALLLPCFPPSCSTNMGCGPTPELPATVVAAVGTISTQTPPTSNVDTTAVAAVALQTSAATVPTPMPALVAVHNTRRLAATEAGAAAELIQGASCLTQQVLPMDTCTPSRPQDQEQGGGCSTSRAQRSIVMHPLHSVRAKTLEIESKMLRARQLLQKCTDTAPSSSSSKEMESVPQQR